MGKKVTLPFVGMILAELAQVGLIILSKKVMSQGMSNFIFIFYSNALAALILLPSSFFIHRVDRPPITFSTLSGCFLLGLLGQVCFILHYTYYAYDNSKLKLGLKIRLFFQFYFLGPHRILVDSNAIDSFAFGLGYFSFLAQAFGYAGIYYSSATLSTAMLNLIPGFTFILAVVFRMEQLDWRSSSSIAKSLGTIVSISGAFVATLYKGPAILMRLSPANSSMRLLLSQDPNWILGGIFLAADCVMASAFLIVQASVLKKFPAELIIVFFYTFFVAILSAVTCLVVERDIGAWSLEPQIKLLVVLYSGVFGSVFQVGVSTWCLHQTGPVFVSMFKPLGIVISVIVGVIFLGDPLYLGSLVGATVIVVGFYSVLWGKAKDIEKVSVRSLESRGKQTPLLEENGSEEI